LTDTVKEELAAAERKLIGGCLELKLNRRIRNMNNACLLWEKVGMLFPRVPPHCTTDHSRRYVLQYTRQWEPVIVQSCHTKVSTM